MAEDYDAAKSLAKALLTPENKSNFERDLNFAPGMRDWYRGFIERYGEKPQTEGGDYNYQLAYALGERPQAYEHDPGTLHWTSSMQVPPYANDIPLKSKNHPTMWMQTFLEKYGMDPNDAPQEMLLQALIDRDVKVPGATLADALRIYRPGRGN